VTEPAPPALVLFDLDGVLVRYDRARRLQALAARTGASVAAVRIALFDSGLEAETDVGRWSPADYAAELGRRLGSEVSLADCIAARRDAMRADDNVLALARAAARRARLAILTNNGPFLTDHLEAMCPPLFPLFAGAVHGAGHYGIAKPDPRVFHACARALRAEPARMLFVDDSPDNVDGARRAGIEAVHFTDAAALADAFARHGLDIAAR